MPNALAPADDFDGQIGSCLACACNSNEAAVDLIASAICLDVP
jgi:hypothetical protein